MTETHVTATCGVCGGTYDLDPREDLREGELCPHCHASGRAQAIAYCLSTYVFQDPKPLKQIPPNKKLRIVGLSDDGIYAGVLRKISRYTNTFYHRRPRLDIVKPGRRYTGTCDAVISADVFEHVTAHPFMAFKGAYDMLKPGGHLILTVPFGNDGEHTEHYPGLKTYRSEQQADGSWVAHIEYADGRTETDTDPCFHGGPGSTLEVRLFTRQSLIGLMQWAGFRDIVFLDENLPERGINWSPFSRAIIARR